MLAVKLDRAPDLRALSSRLHEITDVEFTISGCRRVTTGHANATWFVNAEPERLVIKVQVEPSCVYDRDPALEPAALEALAATGLPVPRLIARDTEGKVFGAPWFAMALVDGRGMPDDPITGYAGGGWFADVPPQRRGEIWTEFVDRLADLHCLPADSFAAIGRGGSHSAMLDYWAAAADDVAGPEALPTQTRALEWLRAAAPADADLDPRPCMGDARMANLLERDGQVVALVDWEVAHVGNPRNDIAYHLFHDHRYAEATGQRLEGLPWQDETWSRWEERTGLAAGDRRYWNVKAGTWFAIIATRMRGLVNRIDAVELERLNPVIPDLRRLLDDVSA